MLVLHTARQESGAANCAAAFCSGNYNLLFLFREKRVGICTSCVIQGSTCRLRGDWSITKLSQIFVQLKCDLNDENTEKGCSPVCTASTFLLAPEGSPHCIAL